MLTDGGADGRPPACSQGEVFNLPVSFFCLIFFNVLFIFETEREHERGRVRERETQNLKQAPGCELSAQRPTRGSNSQTVRS